MCEWSAVIKFMCGVVNDEFTCSHASTSNQVGSSNFPVYLPEVHSWIYLTQGRDLVFFFYFFLSISNMKLMVFFTQGAEILLFI